MIFDRPVIYGTSYKGKLYVGQHIGDGSDYVGSGVIIKDIKKSGNEDKLITGVIEYVDDVNNLNEREIYWIKKLKPKLNLTLGGGGSLGRKHSKETIEKISKSKIGMYVGEKNPMYGKKHSKETKNILSKKQKGENNNFYGKKHSLETLKKMSLTKQGEKHPMYGKKHKEDTKLKMREKKIGVNNHMCKNIEMLYILNMRNQRNKWKVRVPSHKIKSFKNIKEAMIYRDKIVGVN